MLQRSLLAYPVFLGLGLLLLVLPVPVSAHEHVDVGDFEFIVGWVSEPPAEGVMNGLDLSVSRHSTGEPVLGAETSLTATLSTGPASTVEAIRPQFGRPGWYTFDVFLTRDGVYQAQIQGNLEGTDIDFTVTLATVQSRSDLEFPVSDPSNSELEDAILASADEAVALRAQVSTLSIIAVVGVVVGAAGVALASLLLWRSRSGP